MPDVRPGQLTQQSDGLSMQITAEEFTAVAKMTEKLFGIHLPDSKRAMVSCRMYRVVREAGCANFGEFYRRNLIRPTPATLSLLINALSTNHTYFNRENSHFWMLRDQVVPELKAQLERNGQRDLRVWCAASSTGEEPYTLAMMIREGLGRDYDRWRGGLLATDISEDALKKARAGVYPTEGAQELPEPLFRKYFKPAGAGRVSVVPELRSEVTFRRFNLINKSYPFRNPFHVVFCRNVMIYFEEDTKRGVVERIYDSMAPGGWFFVGHAETISGLGTRFKQVQPGVYRRP